MLTLYEAISVFNWNKVSILHAAGYNNKFTNTISVM